MSDPITIEQFKAALPATLKAPVHSSLITQINKRLAHPETWEVFKENLLSYGSVMKEGKFTIPQYVNAVKYVSFKLLGQTNKDAYRNTFPSKYAAFLLANVPAKDIASYSTAYNKSKLVNLIYEQTLIPTHVINAPLFQEALNAQAILMMNAKSEKVRCDAANSILTHLKRPEAQKVELDIGLNHDKTVDILHATTMKLVAAQRDLLRSGSQNAKQIAAAPLKIVGKTDAP